MGNLRPVLLISLLILGYLLWIAWQKDYGAPPVKPVTTEDQAFKAETSADELDLPRVNEQDFDRPPVKPTADNPPANSAAPAGSAIITVVTDVMSVTIDSAGGTVVSARLLNYPVQLDKPEEKVNLLSPRGDALFIAQSGLLSKQAAPNHQSTYDAAQRHYELAAAADELRVPLTWRSSEGIRVDKTFVFKRGQYAISVRHQLHNDSGQVWSGSRYEQLQRVWSGKGEKGGFNNPEAYSFKGIGLYNPADKFQKIKFDDVADEPYSKTASGGWLAMIQHYFFAAWIPPAEEQALYTTQQIQPEGGPPRYIARLVSPPVSANPGERLEFNSRLYLGPKLQDRLEGIAPGLEYTVNYGIFTIFSKPLFWLLSHIHGLVGNWGWAILLLTVLIKAAFFKLSEAQYRSMARMRKLQPRIEQLKERYGDDRQRMSQAMMEMYKTEKVNPLGGCLPILVQIPIFIALYWVLLESVELRQAPFILWIDNLSARDPYFILPALNAGFMIATQRLTPMAGMDPLQQKLMSLMPLVFGVMFAFFPAGLVLYWATNAGLSLAQQVYITRKIGAGAK